MTEPGNPHTAQESSLMLRRKLFEALYAGGASRNGDTPQLVEGLAPESGPPADPVSQAVGMPPWTAEEMDEKSDFGATLSLQGDVGQAQAVTSDPAPASGSNSRHNQLESVISGGSMADLSGYKDLSKAPLSLGDEDAGSFSDGGFESRPQILPNPAHFQPEALNQEVDTEFSGNVKTLIRLVNELPEGVTKQTGAQIIRLTMEAMGISMEDVLSEAQSAQSEMLDAVRANIKKIEEYKTVIRKLETDIKYYQGKANELSEIIDLFILSNTSGNKMPSPDDLSS